MSFADQLDTLINQPDDEALAQMHQDDRMLYELMNTLYRKCVKRKITIKGEFVELVFNGIYQLLDASEITPGDIPTVIEDIQKSLRQYFQIMREQDRKFKSYIAANVKEKFPALEDFAEQMISEQQAKIKATETMLLNQTILETDPQKRVSVKINLALTKVAVKAEERNLELSAFIDGFYDAYTKLFWSLYLGYKDLSHMIQNPLYTDQHIANLATQRGSK